MILLSDSEIQELEASADLVNRICRIMADLPVEPGRAKYWVEVSLLVSKLNFSTVLLDRLVRRVLHTVNQS